MSGLVKIELQTLARTIDVERGSSLQAALHPYGVEFPCGERGRRGDCRVRRIGGDLPVSGDRADILSPAELAQGWRLACRGTVESDVVLEIGQWEMVILACHSSFEFTPRCGLGVAVDLSSTTLVVQLLDPESGRVLAVRTAVNPQTIHGSGVMSRVGR